MNAMNKLRRLKISSLFILSLLFFWECKQEPPEKSIAVLPMMKIPDVFAQNQRLGGGANVGSILYRWDEWDEEREKAELDLLRSLGLTGVRINTRPFLHALQEPPYTISEEFFRRLDWLVDEALTRGFTVIIDEHQYRVMGKDPMGLKACARFNLRVAVSSAPNERMNGLAVVSKNAKPKVNMYSETMKKPNA